MQNLISTGLVQLTKRKHPHNRYDIQEWRTTFEVVLHSFLLKTADHARFFFLSMIKYKHIHEKRLINKVETDEKNRNQRKPTFSWLSNDQRCKK